MIKPKRIGPGSKIAVISPSSGLPSLFPEHYELGLSNLQQVLGLEVIEMPTARMSPEELYHHPQARAEDINQCFSDNRIDGIITSIGGYESIRILPYLDVDKILSHPKLVMGFSDATTFLTYFNQLGMVTFYGPSVMAGFAQLQTLPPEFLQHVNSILFSKQYPYTYKPYRKWTNGYQDWGNLETLGQCQEFYDHASGWRFLQGSKKVVGELWGGCIEVLEFMKATKFWPDPAFWEGKILCFETSEEKPSPRQVGYMLRNYGMQGIFSKINGIIFGRAKDYSDQESLELHQLIVDIVTGEFGAEHVVIVADFDFGHTDPKLILPLGCKVEINPETNEVILLEDPFSDSL